MDRLLMTGFDMGAAPMGAYELELRAHIRMVSLTSGGGGGDGNGDGSDWEVKPKDMLKAGMHLASGQPVKAIGDIIHNNKDTFAKPSDYVNVAKHVSEKYGTGTFKKIVDGKYFKPMRLGPQLQGLKSSAEKLEAAAKKINLGKTAKKFKLGISQARLAISAVDWVVRKVCNGYSVVDELLRKPFGGDWDALEQAASQWEGLSTTLPSVADSLRDVASTIQSGAWEGQAADRCAAVNNRMAQVAQAGAAPTAGMAKALRALAANAEKLFDFVLDVIDEIISVCELIAGELASIVGTVALPATVAYHAYVIFDLINRAVQLINNLITMAQGLVGCLGAMTGLAQQANAAKAQLSAAA